MKIGKICEKVLWQKQKMQVIYTYILGLDECIVVDKKEIYQITNSGFIGAVSTLNVFVSVLSKFLVIQFSKKP